MKISVIIPAYNLERYIGECLQSLTESTAFAQCEVLVIDDGSADKTADVVETFAQKYPNIHLFRFENGGLAEARNRGIRRACGEYLFFLDGDDCLKPDYLEKLLSAAEENKADIALAGFSRFRGDTKKTEAEMRDVLNRRTTMNGLEYLHARMDAGDWHNECWCALYNRKFLKERKLEFLQELRLYEDILFTNLVLTEAQRVYMLPEYGYLYRMRENSLVHSGVQLRDIEYGLKVLDAMTEAYRNLDAAQQKAFGRAVFEHISMVLYYIGEVNPNDKKRYYRHIQKPEVLRILRRSISTPKELVKYIIFRWNIGAFYPLVRKP